MIPIISGQVKLPAYRNEKKDIIIFFIVYFALLRDCIWSKPPSFMIKSVYILVAISVIYSFNVFKSWTVSGKVEVVNNAIGMRKVLKP